MGSAGFLAHLAQGFLLGASLIIAIGSQNAFVLRQGLRCERIFVVCTICFLGDAALISLGVGGFGTLVSSSPLLVQTARWAGAAFLFGYGLRAFRAAITPEVLEIDSSERQKPSLTKVVATSLALTFLNPHVYLDTVLLLGSIAGQLPADSRLLFAAGAICASFVWFYGLGYGARVLAPLFRKPVAWKIMDATIGCVMWAIAVSLLWPILFPTS